VLLLVLSAFFNYGCSTTRSEFILGGVVVVGCMDVVIVGVVVVAVVAGVVVVVAGVVVVVVVVVGASVCSILVMVWLWCCYH